MAFLCFPDHARKSASSSPWQWTLDDSLAQTSICSPTSVDGKAQRVTTDTISMTTHSPHQPHQYPSPALSKQTPGVIHHQISPIIISHNPGPSIVRAHTHTPASSFPGTRVALLLYGTRTRPGFRVVICALFKIERLSVKIFTARY